MNHELQNSKTLIVIAGPTASGKTAAAIQLAGHYQTEIVSADSRQFYSEMSIGTAKPTEEELAVAKHHFINSLSVAESYTAGDFEKDSLGLLNNLFKTHDKVILVGGSGLFIKAVCEGFDEFPATKPGMRERLNRELEEKGISYFQERLKAVDPAYFKQVDPNNPQRLIRALEIFESTGKPFSSFRQSSTNQRPFNIIKFGLTLERKLLYDRINRRVDDMVAQGLVEEAQSLLPSRHLNALNTVGYSELYDYFDGKTDLPTAISLIKQNTRRFAKRQMTWFGRDKDIIWLETGREDLAEEMIRLISDFEFGISELF
jgi:tRNA dimethylallyltransferase